MGSGLAGVGIVVRAPGLLRYQQLRPGGGVAYMAHVGGFVAGMILVFLLGGRAEKRAPVRREGWGYRG